MKKIILASLLPILIFATACRSEQVMWGACEPGNDPWGTDGTYVLGCKDGIWVPTMTAAEYVAIRQGKQVTIAPLPTQPTTTTTTTTAPATTTTAAPATTTTTTSTTTTTTTTTIPTVAPTINALSPNKGPIEGDQVLTINGSGFTGTTGVTVGGAAATNVTVDGDTHLIVHTPAHALGTVDVVVTNPSGSATMAASYTYQAKPVVTSVSPATGPVAGGTTVTITGTGLANAGVTFSGANGMVTASTDTSITVTTPAAAAAGEVDVRAFTYGGLSDVTASTAFTYVSAP